MNQVLRHFTADLPLRDGYIAIPLTRGMFAIASACDAEVISRHVWCVSGAGQHMYACTSLDKRSQPMHRIVLGAQPGQLVDHINGLTLDNRRENLRLCSNSDNMRNSMSARIERRHRYKGACAFEAYGRTLWRSHITPFRGKPARFLGNFDTELDAALAYDTAAKLFFGEFARLNFPEGSVVPHHVNRCDRRTLLNAEKLQRRLARLSREIGNADH